MTLKKAAIFSVIFLLLRLLVVVVFVVAFFSLFESYQFVSIISVHIIDDEWVAVVLAHRWQKSRWEVRVGWLVGCEMLWTESHQITNTRYNLLVHSYQYSLLSKFFLFHMIPLSHSLALVFNI